MPTLRGQWISPFTKRLLATTLAFLSTERIVGDCRSLLFRATTAFKTEASAAPWQSKAHKSNNWDNLRRYQRMPPSIFAPGGRLHSVERAMEALSSSDDPTCNLVIALNCRDGLLVATNGNQPPNAAMFVSGEEGKQHNTNGTSTNSGDGNPDFSKLEERRSPLWLESPGGEGASHLPSWSLPSISILSIPLAENENLFAITAGYALHSQILRHRIRQMADSIYQTNRDDIFGTNTAWLQRIRSSPTVSVLTRRLADHFQRPTQNQGQKVPRMLVSCALIVGANEGIWQIDPTGQFWQCQLAVVGCGADKARSHLVEKILVKSSFETNGGEHTDTAVTHAQLRSLLNNLSIPDALELVGECFQRAIGCNPAITTMKASNENGQTCSETSRSRLHQPFLAFSVLRTRAGREELVWYRYRDVESFSDGEPSWSHKEG